MTGDNSAPHVVLTDGTASTPELLPLLMLRKQVLFPMAALPIRLTDPHEKRLIDEAVLGPKMVALLTLREQDGEAQGLDAAYDTGTTARILQLQRLPDDSLVVLLQALSRFRPLGLTRREPYPFVRVQLLEDQISHPDKIPALATAIRQQMTRYAQLSPSMPDEAAHVLDNIEDPGRLADIVAANLNIPIEEKQRLLSLIDPRERLERLVYLISNELQVMETSHKIQAEVKSSIDASQREFYLRQQLKAIQDELGMGGRDHPEIDTYREKIEALQINDAIRKEALRELDRLGQMNESSAEYHVILTYLDWFTDLPWNNETRDQLDIGRAEEILDEDHYGLAKVKKRILEYLAVRKLQPEAPGPILCFAGPPGVGKTSLGQSIARALGRTFVRMSLGGLHDEAEIRGHRRTYVGAMPGRILQGIRKAGSNNPVFMLDEMDKAGADFRGDPSSALLEVLDPAQNNSFNDNYLNVPFDLSRVMFIGTANVLDTIPWALRDRMEIIEIPGYILEEKVHIARNYLVPRQMTANGIPPKRVTITAAALRRIVESYTREAGVRNLEREIGAVLRGCATAIAKGRRKPIRIDAKDLGQYLGPERFYREVLDRTRLPGVATGLAWTPTGGDILFVEATRMPGKGGLTLTGQMGDVMKESAQAVLSYVRANAESLGVSPEDFRDFDIHIHVPAGAVPKDGPSAGVTMLTAVASLLTGKKVKPNLAMTGEITLRGLVLPVGGIKEKVLAAIRAGVKHIILPERCAKDLDEVPEKARKKVTFYFVSEMREVLHLALGLKL
ncbi:MAG TPA: endopeptidase La [Candidatus Hydrogenedentes bacterium]|jgi:ATP-dependent Lon protease|nr:endopeptidase La [Candidatus Hydrogenedentota bacterium]HPJ97968.1 endopeptidase La [Candidatus Hydrogenedentota bacterium]